MRAAFVKIDSCEIKNNIIIGVFNFNRNCRDNRDILIINFRDVCVWRLEISKIARRKNSKPL